MRLIHYITARFALALLPVIALWAMTFFFVMMDEINDEADDLLESYAEQLISQKLSGQELPIANIMTDKHYSIIRVTPSYVDSHLGMEYYDADSYIEETDETEPARFLRIIFKDKEDNYFELTVFTPTFEKDDLMQTILWWILTLYLTMLLTVVVIAPIVLRKSMRPFYQILEWLGNYTPGGSQNHPNATSNVYEFIKLETTVSDMADRSNEAFEKQKQFIGNASHELQTPLAVLEGRIDLMLDGDSLNEETMGELVQMKRELNHLVRLNKALLLLTKIDNGQFPEVSDVNLSVLLKEQINLYNEIFEGKNINCNVSIVEKDVVVRMNVTLATIMITNIIKNAFVHSDKGGEIYVTLSESRLSVKNSGISPLDGDSIFDRFYQGSKKEGSTGLGLALAKTIADKNGVRLTYTFKDGKHRFDIIFFRNQL